MSTFHPHNGWLAPVLGVSSVLEQWLAANPRALVFASGDLRRWQLGGLLAQPRVRSVGQGVDLLASLSVGSAAADGPTVIIGPAEQLKGTLPAGAVGLGISDSGWGDLKLSADYQLAPADLHESAAALRWALTAAQSGHSTALLCQARAVPLIWSNNTAYNPDRWNIIGSSSRLLLVVGSALAPVRSYLEEGRPAVRVVAITDLLGRFESKKTIRGLVLGVEKINLLRPPGQAEWLPDLLLAMKKGFRDQVLKPDWRGYIDYSDKAHEKVVSSLLRRDS